MDREAKRLAEQLIESYGPNALIHPRGDVADLLEDKGLDHNEQNIDAFMRYMQWLWEE